MKICPQCKTTHSDNMQLCTRCKINLIENTTSNIKPHVIYSRTENLICGIMTIICFISLIALSYASGNYQKTIYIIAAVISASEIYFIVIYRDFIDSNKDSPITTKTDFIFVTLFKILSITCSSITLGVLFFVSTLIYEILKLVYPFILPLLATLSALATLFLANTLLIRYIYKTSK